MEKQKRPIIGVMPLFDDERDSLWMLPGYFDGITEAGGLPIMLPLTADKKILGQCMEMCSGVLLTGGHDVSPALYGEDRLDDTVGCCERRDEMEKEVLKIALEKDKAVLGICRGIQFINAALGGTLYQDLPKQHPSDVDHHQSPPYDIPVHDVNIIQKTPLSELLETDILSVNSYHHQGIKELAPGLEPMAASTDGLIEAVFRPTSRFLWAVQWHPEFSHQNDPASRAILHRFVVASESSVLIYTG
ncbi:MAG: gamma-glutamyl-gamma-aminobutyrate hydrolase family protein [Lachnospiraceae bacterium]|nr:gamma-glutamyl-gamma-aminobutyrate hydrolase family protein [Lachnospiraceae bacterium]